jgi:hypothetical protein
MEMKASSSMGRAPLQLSLARSTGANCSFSTCEGPGAERALQLMAGVA